MMEVYRSPSGLFLPVEPPKPPETEPPIPRMTACDHCGSNNMDMFEKTSSYKMFCLDCKNSNPWRYSPEGMFGFVPNSLCGVPGRNPEIQKFFADMVREPNENT